MANLWINHLQMKTEITLFPRIRDGPSENLWGGGGGAGGGQKKKIAQGKIQ